MHKVGQKINKWRNLHSLKSQKGQESIVFEVLIAVILMTFVFVIGGYAMKSLNETKCSKEIDLSMSQLASAIEKAGATSIGTYYYKFSPSSCFRNKETSYELKSESATLCSSYCPGTNYCYLLKYQNQQDPVSPLRYKCVNISKYVGLNNTGICSAQGDYDVMQVNPTIFHQGDYLFESKSLTVPSICIYYKQ
ncbi:MAG: hypothetical protein PHH82_03490 [Candidatus ainarchaeum sp.]|nr:hypothetical protein [Candidatus ainarchaeum sp.]